MLLKHRSKHMHGVGHLEIDFDVSDRVICTLRTPAQEKSFVFPIGCFKENNIFEVHVWGIDQTGSQLHAPMTQRIAVYFKKAPDGGLMYFAARCSDIGKESLIDIIHMLHMTNNRVLDDFMIAVMQKRDKYIGVKYSNEEYINAFRSSSIDVFIYDDPFDAMERRFIEAKAFIEEAPEAPEVQNTKENNEK